MEDKDELGRMKDEPSSFLSRRLLEAAQEQEGSGARVADEEDKGMVGPEDRRRWRLLADAGRANRHNGGRGGFGAFFIHFSPCLMEDTGNKKLPGPIHSGEIGLRSEGSGHAHARQRLIEKKVDSSLNLGRKISTFCFFISLSERETNAGESEFSSLPQPLIWRGSNITIESSLFL